MKSSLRVLTKRYISSVLVCSMLVGSSSVVLAVKNPEKENNKKSKEDWTMVWNDEFDGTELDKSKWTYDLGNWIVDENGNGVSAGWGNEELQNYTKDNVEVEDGNLVITAKKEETSDEYGEYNYTSSRIKTKGLFAKKYGKFEARMALPAESALWPAFWMLPEDDVYGGWASSGEIDIMEARGRLPHEVEGTLHYGGQWPDNKYTGKTYEFAEGTDMTEFHDYAIEWEPGEIRWYVDGELYQTQNNWYTKGSDGEEEYSFPAPFDQEFHLLLNLAVGGWFDGGETPSDSFEEAQMLVDYVRVYELTGRDYMKPKDPSIEKDPIPEDAKSPINGNYIYDTNYNDGFTIVNDSSIELSKDKWNLVTLPDFGGAANVETENIEGSTFAKVNITNGGNQSYSTQVIQHVPMVKGRTYRLSYDAKSNVNRNMVVKVSGGEDRGWSTYSNAYNVDLTSNAKRYVHTFTMAQDTDLNARLELNMGLNTNPIWLGNVVLEEIEPLVDYDAPKEPLASGNHIYNGAFDKGTVDRRVYWNLDIKNGTKANYSVDEKDRELFIDITGKKKSQPSDIVLNQKGIKLEQDGEYELSFNSRTTSDKGKDITVVVKNKSGNIILKEIVSLSSTMEKYSVNLNMPQGMSTENEGIVEFWVGDTDSNKDVYLDNVALKSIKIEEPGIVNGDFNEGKKGWSAWSWFNWDSFINDNIIITEDKKANISIPAFDKDGDGAQTWAVQLKQNNLKVNKDTKYKVSFEVSSDIERDMEVVVQNIGYYRHLGEKITIDSNPKTYNFEFTSTGTEQVELNLLLGKYGEYDAHNIYIDNVVFEISK